MAQASGVKAKTAATPAATPSAAPPVAAAQALGGIAPLPDARLFYKPDEFTRSPA